MVTANLTHIPTGPVTTHMHALIPGEGYWLSVNITNSKSHPYSTFTVTIIILLHIKGRYYMQGSHLTRSHKASQQHTIFNFST